MSYDENIPRPLIGETTSPVSDEYVPMAAKEDRDVNWVDVTGWGVFEGHAIPVSVARKIAERINLYHAIRSELSKGRGA